MFWGVRSPPQLGWEGHLGACTRSLSSSGHSSAEDLHMLPIDHQELSESCTAGIKLLAAVGEVQTDPALPNSSTWLDFSLYKLELGRRPVAWSESPGYEAACSPGGSLQCNPAVSHRVWVQPSCRSPCVGPSPRRWEDLSPLAPWRSLKTAMTGSPQLHLCVQPLRGCSPPSYTMSHFDPSLAIASTQN